MAHQFMKEEDEDKHADNFDESDGDSDNYYPEMMEDYGYDVRPRM